jgi:hypothetical protein
LQSKKATDSYTFHISKKVSIYIILAQLYYILYFILSKTFYVNHTQAIFLFNDAWKLFTVNSPIDTLTSISPIHHMEKEPSTIDKFTLFSLGAAPFAGIVFGGTTALIVKHEMKERGYLEPSHHEQWVQTQNSEGIGEIQNLTIEQIEERLTEIQDLESELPHIRFALLEARKNRVKERAN